MSDGFYYNRTSAGRMEVDPSLVTSPVSGTVTAVLSTAPFAQRSDTFTATGNGTTVDASTSPLQQFAIQVSGTTAVPSLWNVRLESSLDNSTFTQLLLHSGTVSVDGGIIWTETQTYPSLYFRSRVASLIRGSASNIVVNILGVR